LARIGIYGGSFDPVHWGHLRPVIAAREQMRLDQVIYLPTAEPPHKTAQRFAPASARFTMVELALLEQPDLVVSDYEMRRGASYTVETLEHVRRELTGDRLFLLIGYDSWLELAAWRRFAELPQLAELVVMDRPGSAEAPLEAVAPPLREAAEAGRVSFLHGPRIDLSSRALRRAWADGEPPTAEQVPPLVLDYLRKYSLYR
jgi:nicotinate-nucleotide adenylyltransferase